nr:MAG TPA: hypothetical protein [Caudoviricetes sp.]
MRHLMVEGKESYSIHNDTTFCSSHYELHNEYS